ncbi:hypothetical protein DXZ20_07200 [Leptolyngbyaceae cyanobacterium CCMR0081]|uniref:Uncharacterized protein n=1 Tax=Adonisia turfae CCMR0081 TaxID=2292702 RepID=A0A6M0RGU1_9CYAN|nr:hypothetical protein [Adonisia turfae CCMR0081]
MWGEGGSTSTKTSLTRKDEVTEQAMDRLEQILQRQPSESKAADLLVRSITNQSGPIKKLGKSSRSVKKAHHKTLKEMGYGKP